MIAAEVQPKPKPKAAPKEDKYLAFREKVFLGGLGALTPIVVNLLVIDLERVFSNITIIVALSYFLRVLTLFYLGGIVAFLHRDEQDRLKLFELGIVAPALITALLNASYATQANKAQVSPAPEGKQSHYSAPAVSFDIIATAYAGENPGQIAATPSNPLPTFSAPAETTSEQILRGFLGTTSGRVWFVVVGSYSSLDNARQYAAHINKSQKGLNAETYAPYDTPYYAVVVGANLSLKEATQLRNKVRQTGIAKDVYIKRGPDPT